MYYNLVWCQPPHEAVNGLDNVQLIFVPHTQRRAQQALVSMYGCFLIQYLEDPFFQRYKYNTLCIKWS